MTADEFDSAIAAKARTCAYAKRLPDGFGDRLAKSLRRRRGVAALRNAALFAALAAAAVWIAGLFGRDAPDAPRRCEIASAEPPPTGGHQVTNALLLGLFGECARRGRTWREEDEDDEPTSKERKTR